MIPYQSLFIKKIELFFYLIKQQKGRGNHFENTPDFALS